MKNKKAILCVLLHVAFCSLSLRPPTKRRQFMRVPQVPHTSLTFRGWTPYPAFSRKSEPQNRRGFSGPCNEAVHLDGASINDIATAHVAAAVAG